MIVFGAPQQTSEAALYEDDGDTAAWKSGAGLEIHLRLRREAGGRAVGNVERLLSACLQTVNGASGRGRRPGQDRIVAGDGVARAGATRAMMPKRALEPDEVAGCAPLCDDREGQAGSLR